MTKRITLSAILAVAMLLIAWPAASFAQVGLEEGRALSPASYGSTIRVFSSSIDTINATANDTTGVMRLDDYTGSLVFVYTVASGGTVSIDMITMVGASRTGPWIVCAHDTISATGTAGVDVTELDTLKLPFLRIIADGIGSNAADTHFTALYVIAGK